MVRRVVLGHDRPTCETETYAKLLGIEAPWYVRDVDPRSGYRLAQRSEPFGGGQDAAYDLG